MQPDITSLGELKKSGYQPQSIKEELRKNLIDHLQSGHPLFEGIIGYNQTVIPEIERAILSGHNINLLGLRGQAKTRIARLMTQLLDEYIPIIKGSEINDDPLNPIGHWGKKTVEELGDKTPIDWLHRSERYVEKLATPDVSVADLIGDLDPIKAVNEKLSYNDPRAIHYGLIPRSHRCIFVLNELPDLQARIQVALFNILQEGDVQIRGFKMRLPLDLQFVFTANPEDYTNRGAIITPLKDRIGSQILTHYPHTLQEAKQITAQESTKGNQRKLKIELNELLANIIERISIEARQNEYVDAKSGVSARLSISAMENLISSAEHRALINKEKKTQVRIADLWGVIPAITGKIEMVYEGEQEGPLNVAQILIGKAIRSEFGQHFPVDKKLKKAESEENSPYAKILNWFEKGNHLSIGQMDSDSKYAQQLNEVEGLAELVQEYDHSGNMERYLWMEFVLHGLAEYSKLNKKSLGQRTQFSDLFDSVFSKEND